MATTDDRRSKSAAYHLITRQIGGRLYTGENYQEGKDMLAVGHQITPVTSVLLQMNGNPLIDNQSFSLSV